TQLSEAPLAKDPAIARNTDRLERRWPVQGGLDPGRRRMPRVLSGGHPPDCRRPTNLFRVFDQSFRSRGAGRQTCGAILRVRPRPSPRPPRARVLLLPRLPRQTTLRLFQLLQVREQLQPLWEHGLPIARGFPLRRSSGSRTALSESRVVPDNL